MLIEARQQLALVLPMWCTLWLAAAAWVGRWWALPWLALAASFVLQTHFTYAYQTVAVAAASTIAFIVHQRRTGSELVKGIGLRRRDHGALLGAAVLGPALRVGERGRRARTVGRLGALGRSIARHPHPRRVGVRPAVLHAGVDGRPPAPRLTTLAARRRARPRGVGGPAPRHGDRHAPASPRSRRHGRGRRRRPCRLGGGGDQDPTDRAVRDHRPELLLDLADRRVSGHGGRRQRAARTVPTVGRVRRRRCAEGGGAGDGRGDGAGSDPAASADQPISRRPTTSGPSAVSSPGRCSTTSVPASTKSISPARC